MVGCAQSSLTAESQGVLKVLDVEPECASLTQTREGVCVCLGQVHTPATQACRYQTRNTCQRKTLTLGDHLTFIAALHISESDAFASTGIAASLPRLDPVVADDAAIYCLDLTRCAAPQTT